MGLELFKAKLKDEPELLKEIESLYESNNENVKRIGVLETELSGAIEKKKNLQDMVREVTGISELSKDNLKKFAENADEGLKADNETLQANYQKLKDEFDAVGTKHEAEVSEMILKDTLRGLGISDKVQNDRAFQELTKLVLDGAERDGATFKFKDGDKTLFNERNQPMTVEDKVLELQNGEFSFLFKQAQGGGAGEVGVTPTTKEVTEQRAKVAMIKDKFL